MRETKLLFIILCVAVFGFACSQAANNATVANSPNANRVVSQPEKTAEPSPDAVVENLLAGKELYAKNCMICHKESGKGGKITLEGKTINPDDLTTAKMAEKTDEKLYGYILNGFPDDGMPAFKEKLKEAEIKAIVAHVRTLQ